MSNENTFLQQKTSTQHMLITFASYAYMYTLSSVHIGRLLGIFPKPLKSPPLSAAA